MSDRQRKSGKLQLLLIAAVFLGPLIIATWLYFGGTSMQPAARSNHGTLLEPIVNLGEVLPDSKIGALGPGHWRLLFADLETCGERCRQSLYTLRQSRLMLGREMDRVVRVFLHGETPPDTLFLAEVHEGLMTAEDTALHTVLSNKKPDALPAGGYYLIDPLGNLVMYFEPDIDPGDMVDDIKHLLRLSQIG